MTVEELQTEFDRLVAEMGAKSSEHTTGHITFWSNHRGPEKCWMTIECRDAKLRSEQPTADAALLELNNLVGAWVPSEQRLADILGVTL